MQQHNLAQESFIFRCFFFLKGRYHHNLLLKKKNTTECIEVQKHPFTDFKQKKPTLTLVVLYRLSHGNGLFSVDLCKTLRALLQFKAYDPDHLLLHN